MAWKQIETTAVGLIVAALAIYSVKQYNAQVSLRDEMEALRQKLARLQSENDQLSARPARSSRVSALQISPLPVPKTIDLYDRLKDRNHKLKREQLASYLKAHGRNAASLLAAFRTSGDQDLLKEAMEKFPGDPQVAFEAVCNTNLSGGDKRQWLDNFEKNDPDNALANYLSALNYFNSGQTNLAAQELTAASGKIPNDFNSSRMQDDMEAYVGAGYPIAEAEEVAGAQLLLPQLTQVKQLALATVGLASSYNQAGDTASGQAMLQTAMNMGQQYADSSCPFLLNQLVGIAIQRIALNAMDPGAPYGDSGLTVQDQINQLVQQRTEIGNLADQVQPLMPLMSDQDWILYREREMMFGEENAAQWVVTQYGGQQGIP